MVLIILGVYISFVLVFDVALHQIIPKSLLTMYMLFVVAGTVMVFTFTEEGAQELVGPIKALVEDPSKKMIRNVVFVVVPLLAGYYTYSSMLPSYEAPMELRSTHPAPPTKYMAYVQSFNLITLENPY